MWNRADESNLANRVVNIIIRMFSLRSSEMTGLGKCMVCLVLNLTTIFYFGEGKLKFTLEPPNPSYVRKGSNATLVWQYSVDDKQAELQGIVFSVLNSNVFAGMVAKTKDGAVLNLPNIPSAYKGRVSIKGNATLIIENVSPQDNTRFQCRLSAEPGAGQDRLSIVQLIVTEIPVINPPSINGSYIEGSSVNITCTASGKPDPEVSWIRNGQIKSSGKKTAYLNFDQIKRTDDGLYTCTANNSAGTKTHVEIMVVRYPAKILSVTSSAVKSWIGQTVTLKCVSDGVPTPTLTWYEPDGRQINNVTATQNIVDVQMTLDQDFGGYQCDADNGLTPVFKIVKIEQIKKPDSPTITQVHIQATSLTVKWTTPANDGGSSITGYRVVILKGDTEIRNKNITDPDKKSWIAGELERDTKYTLKVLARNAVFEGPAAEEAVKTKYEGVPATATIDDLPSEVTDDTITLKWNKPQNNGKVITQYTVYKRIVTDGKPGEWIKLKTIKNISVRELKVELEKDKEYEFVVTATNKLGESLKEGQKIRRVRVRSSDKSGGGDGTQTGGGDDGNGMGPAIYAGVAAAGVLLIIGIIVIIVLWRRRKQSSHEDTSRDELGSANPYEIEDGYQSVSREAAESLQASGPAGEPNYAQVDPSRKKKNRRPPSDEYAQVDKSKKSKKKKKPGELDYADLGDLRADIQLAPVPSGAAAAAAAPVVRPPAYEGTEYAEISQFGVPQPDPTYANVPKKEVVYSNVESM